MTDYEMTEACGKAMGLRLLRGTHWNDGPYYVKTDAYPVDGEPYRPLENDEQAMALIKNFAIRLIKITYTDGGSNQWSASVGFLSHALNENLNRAIVECVASLQNKRSREHTDAAPQAGKTRTAPRSAEEHPEKPAVAAHTVCTVCGGRAAACAVLGHRPPGDETKWY